MGNDEQEIMVRLRESGQEAMLRGKWLLVFLRHPGCIFTSTTLTELGRVRSKIESAGYQIALVHLDPDASCAEQQSARFGLAGVRMIADPERQIYRAAGMEVGKLRQLLGWRMWWVGAKAFFQGHRQSKIKADVKQLAGVLLLSNGGVVKRHPCADAAEVPPFLSLIQSSR
jgi:hypothetical protein